jgi:murein L,D-transpeptidase YcbB/YkuD
LIVKYICLKVQIFKPACPDFNMCKKMNTGLCRWSLIVALFFAACSSNEKPKEVDIVEIPEQFEVRVHRNLATTLDFILGNKGRLNDTVVLAKDSLVHYIYRRNQFQPIWCRQERWAPIGDSLYNFIERSKEYGLFPGDYHYRALTGLRHMIATDSAAHKDAALWSRADLMLTDAFLLLCKHLKQGHLDYDSVTLRTDTILKEEFYTGVFDELKFTRNVRALLQRVEPVNPNYVALKGALKQFLDSVGPFRRYTTVPYPQRDSVALHAILQRRLFEEDILLSPSDSMSAESWRQALLQYQKSKGLKETGRINANTVQSLNFTNWEKFKRVAVTLDRYRLLPDTLPPTYIWVTLPSYYLQVIDSGTVALESRVIVGTAKTRTPLLTSSVSNFITYPQWTVPYSIIFKEMLPQIQKDVAYLAKQNLMVVDKNDSIIHPDSINWKKLSKKYFPYLLKQRQGDDNSLGVLKFNFPNKYAVYLHDTNARWLFSKSSRALSHGCVRVKEFQRLANFLVRNDSVRYHPDTLRNWIRRQEKHIVSGFQRVPIYLRYFSTDAKEGRLVFHDDIYGEDKALRERYFADKAML